MGASVILRGRGGVGHLLSAFRGERDNRRAKTSWSNRKFDDSRPVIFLHIPKSAGTSFRRALEYSLGENGVWGFDNSTFAQFREFDSLDNIIRSHIYLEKEHRFPTGRLSGGHLGYQNIKRNRPNAQVVTVLREPFSRLISHWLYWRSHTDQHLSGWGGWGDRVRHSRKPLVDFLAQPSTVAVLDNLAVRMLLWPHPLIPDNEYIDRRHGPKLLADACEILRKFAFVDVIENPQLSDRLAEWLGKPFVLERLNETDRILGSLRRSLADELNPDALNLIEDRTWLDRQLWTEVALRSMPDLAIHQVRERALLRNVSRFAVTLAGGLG